MAIKGTSQALPGFSIVDCACFVQQFISHNKLNICLKDGLYSGIETESHISCKQEREGIDLPMGEGISHGQMEEHDPGWTDFLFWLLGKP